MIRKIRAEDMREASEVNKLLFPAAANSISEEFSVEMDKSYVAVENGRIIGISIVVIAPLDSEYIPGIASFGILEQCRGRGVGRKLLESTIQKRPKIWLMVRESNSPAIGLYEASGFKKLYVHKNYYRWPREDGIAMIKLNLVMQ